MMDNVNTVGDALRDTFSSLINKDGKIFKALVANPEGNGTIEQMINGFEAARDKWCNSPDFYEQDGEILEKTISFFSFLTRLFGEDDRSLKRRNELLFYRDGDTVWGDIWDVRKIFRKFFDTDEVYIVNNTNPIEENLIADGDFETQNNSWLLDGCAYDSEACFKERTGVKFSDAGTCKQTVNVARNSTYFLHFFLEGKIAVQIKDNNGRYWNPRAGEFGAWSTAEKSVEFNAGKWDAKSVFFLTDNAATAVTVNFIGLSGESAFLDYVRLFLKEAYSTFTLIVIFGGIYTEDTLGFAPGTKDPINTTVDYSQMSYIEQSHIFGMAGELLAKSIYTELLEMVRAGGITSYIELLARESDKWEAFYV